MITGEVSSSINESGIVLEQEEQKIEVQDPVTKIILSRGGILNLTKKIAEDPINVYITLKERRVSGGVNFSFPEAAPVIHFLAQQMKDQPPSQKALDVWDSLKQSFFKELRNVCTTNFAYLYTLNFIHKHLESLHYYYLKAGFYEGRWTSQVSYPPDTMREYAIFLTRINHDPSIIAFPTIENLSPGYFAKIQSIRAYPLAVSIVPETSADGQNMSPTHMIVHDMQHIEDGEKAFQKTEGTDELEKMKRCQSNYLRIKNAFADLKIKSLWKACKLMLFEASHELDAIKYVPHDLKNKIEEERFISTIVYRIQNKHFEKADATMIAFLEPAKSNLLQIIDSNLLI